MDLQWVFNFTTAVNLLVLSVAKVVLLLQDFDELLHIAEEGDHRNIDMLVCDIYGGTHGAHGLPADLIASSFGKAARSTRDNSRMPLLC